MLLGEQRSPKPSDGGSYTAACSCNCQTSALKTPDGVADRTVTR